MFFENTHLQHPRCYHEFFLRSRPYRGELPTVAGFLLYPDAPVKMETTSREAFSFKPPPRRGKGDNTTSSTWQQSLHPHPTTSSQTGKGKSHRPRQTKVDEQEGVHNHSDTPTKNNEKNTIEMKSQYQKDFPPPSYHMRQSPALPQPDNICINPAFRIEFNTVQRDAYPGWPIKNHRHAGRLRAASSTHHV